MADSNKPIQFKELADLEPGIRTAIAAAKELEKALTKSLDNITKSAKELKTTISGQGLVDAQTLDSVMKLKNEANQLAKSKEQLTKANKDLQATRTTAAKQLTEVERAQKKLQQSTGATAKEVARIRVETQKNNQANKEAAKLASRTIGAYEKTAITLNRLRKQYKDLAIQNKQNTGAGKALLNQITTLDAKLKQVDASVGQFQRSVGNYAQATQQLGQRLNSLNSAFGVTLGLVGSVNLFKNATNTIKDFEKANAVLAGVLGTNLEGVKALTAEAKRLGSTTVKSASEVTALQESLARLGFAQKDIINLTPALIDGSIALNSDLAQTADLVGSVVKSFDNLDSEDAPQIVDALTKATQKSALSFEKLNTALPIVSGAANALGISLEEQTALLGKLSDAGIDASSSATALRNIFLKSAKEGVPYTKLLEDVTSSQSQLAKANELFGARGAVVAQVLAKNADASKALQKELENAGGTAASVAQTQLNTLDGAVKGLESAWEGFILSLNEGSGFISNTLVGAVKFLTDNIKTVGTVIFGAAAGFLAFKVAQAAASAVTSLYNGVLAVQTFAVKTLNKENKLGIIIEKAITGVRTVAAAITGNLAAKTQIATKAQELFNKALKANPIGLVITAIVALVGAFKLLEDGYESITDANNEFITSQRIGREEIFKDIENSLKEKL